MKTNATPSTDISTSALQRTAGLSRFANYGRLGLATACVSLVSFSAVPQALAAGADGEYAFNSASGSLRFDGDSVDIPQALVKRIANVTDGEITIRNNTIRVNKAGTVRVIENLGDDLNAEVEASATGPNTVVLTKTGNRTFSGKTTSPIVTSFEGDIFGEDFSGELKTRVSATVEGKTLTMVIRFSGETLGEDFSGRITIIAKR
jgi:hypothetical protein